MTFLSSIHSTTTFNTIKFLLHVYNMLMVSMHNTGWTAIQFIIFIFTETKKQLFYIPFISDNVIIFDVAPKQLISAE